MTADRAVVGTPAFMAPEQASGKPVDPRADLFSVGTVMYTLLTRKNLFSRDHMMATLGAVGFEVQAPVSTIRPDVPKEYSDFLDRLLSKNPGGRPMNAKSALQELAAIQKSLAERSRMVVITKPVEVWSELTQDDSATDGVPPIQKTKSKKQAQKPPKSKLLMVGGLFGLLLLVGGFTMVITNRDGTKTTIEVPDDAKVEVKDKGKTLASVGGKKDGIAKKDTPKPNLVMDADRKAAEFIIGKGGYVILTTQKVVSKLNELPAEPFKIWQIFPERLIGYADLEHFERLTDLWSLHVAGPITDAGLANLANAPVAAQLGQLIVHRTKLTDGGPRVLPKFAQLQGAGFRICTDITVLGLKHLKDLPISHLVLDNTTIKPKEYVRVAELPN